MSIVRWLGLDYGKKRIGIALSDPLGLTAQPAGMVLRSRQLVEELARIVEEKEVSEIVIGYPRHLDGRPSELVPEIERLAEELKTRTGCPVHFWDERFTTSASERLLIEADVRRSKRKEVRDTVAAALILQGYMEGRSNR